MGGEHQDDGAGDKVLPEVAAEVDGTPVVGPVESDVAGSPRVGSLPPVAAWERVSQSSGLSGNSTWDRRSHPHWASCWWSKLWVPVGQRRCWMSLQAGLPVFGWVWLAAEYTGMAEGLRAAFWRSSFFQALSLPPSSLVWW